VLFITKLAHRGGGSLALYGLIFVLGTGRLHGVDGALWNITIFDGDMAPPT
jgi:hypothetical protein